VSFLARAAGRTAIIAHRGASTLGPENTRDAFRAALAIGVDAVETDVRLTADGVPVCCHDVDLSRIAGDPRAVADLDLSTFRSLVPDGATLAEAADLLLPAVDVMLDVKETEPDRFATLLDALPRALDPAHVAFAIRRPVLAGAVRARSPGATLLALSGSLDEIDAFVAAGCTIVRLWQSDATPGRIAALRARGLGVTVMMGTPTTTGSGRADEAGVASALALRPDAICLDDAGLAMRMCADTHLSSSLHRHVV
jgi:glycerophosphoryl diester phosphodiesterase